MGVIATPIIMFILLFHSWLAGCHTRIVRGPRAWNGVNVLGNIFDKVSMCLTRSTNGGVVYQ